MPAIDLSILNQRQTPAFYADVFANRPAAGFVGRIFVSTNTFAFYRDNGTGWDLIGGPGTGTITGSGATGQIALWDGASTITGDSGLTYNGTDNSLTASKFIVTGGTSSQFLKADGSVDSNSYVPYTGATASLDMGLNNILGQNYFIRGDNTTSGGYLGFRQFNGSSSGTSGYTSISALAQNSLYLQFSQLDTTNKTIVLNSGLLGTTPRQYQFPDADGTLALTSNILNIYNSNGTLSSERTVALNNFNLIFDGGATTARVRLDADTNVARIFSFATNNLPRFAIRVDGTESGGNTGSDYAIRRYDDAGAFVDAPLTITRSTGQSTFAKKVVIENNAGDQQLQIVSTTAPSIRLDNAQTGATKRAGLGISTATNNFIQGSADQDYCIFNSSTTASPILFGIYDAGLTNTQEAARISASRNFLIGTTTDAGQKLQVNGTGRFTGDLTGTTATFSSTITNNVYTTAGSIANPFFNDVYLLGITNSYSKIQWGNEFNNTFGTYLRFIVNGVSGFNTPVTALTINPSGAAIFSNSVYIGGTSSAKLTVKEVTTGYTGYFGESQTSAASNGLIALQSGRIPQSGGDTSGKSGFEFLHSYGTGGVNGDANGGYIESIRESVFGTTSAVNTSLTFGTASANVNGEVFRITATKNLLINTSVDEGQRLQINGRTRTQGLELNADYTNSLTTDASYASGFVTVIPTNTLTVFATYLITAKYSVAGAPYNVHASFLLTTLNTNGSGSDLAITPLNSTHQGSAGVYMEFCSVAGGSQACNGLQVKFTGFANTSGTLVITANYLKSI
jgi:hypothetical protein